MSGKWIREPTGTSSVVFVHGILSSGETCWQNPNGTYWPELLENESEFKSLGIYVHTYQTSFGSGTYSLSDVVDNLKECLFTFDHVDNSKKIIFVCHSMGGIVVRKFLVERAHDLIDRKIEVGLYLVASPSLGSEYANWLEPIAKFIGHTQAQALCFTQDNLWLNDLDKTFYNLLGSTRLKVSGRELLEDKFITLKKFFWLEQVVPPFTGHRYFPECYKVPYSDHFSIAKPKDKTDDQHRLLVDFLKKVVLIQKTSEEQRVDNMLTSKNIDSFIENPSNYNPNETLYRELCRLKNQLEISETKDYELLKEIRSNLKSPKPTILDVGCSDGYYSFSRFDNVDEWGKVYGIDKDEDMIKLGIIESKNKKNTFNLICKDIIKIATENKKLKSLFKPTQENLTFDVIILINTLHHLGTKNQSNVIKYLWKHLEPGGAMIIKTCDDSLRAIHPDPDNNSEKLLDLTYVDVPGTSDRYNGRKLYSLLRELPPKTVEKIQIEYFMYDNTGMNETQSLNFFAYDNSFRIDTLVRAYQINNDEKILEKLRQAKIIYDNFNRNIVNLFRDKKPFYELAAEVVGIAFKKI